MSELILFVFFFQAEDGIRDLVRSRGLGDVYKRQLIYLPIIVLPLLLLIMGLSWLLASIGVFVRDIGPVSYTHLTLPTSDLV